MGLLGLLEPADREPVVAVEEAHVDEAIGDGQAVRVAAEPWETT